MSSEREQAAWAAATYLIDSYEQTLLSRQCYIYNNKVVNYKLYLQGAIPKHSIK